MRLLAERIECIFASSNFFIMQKLFLILAILIVAIACSPAKIAVDDAGWQKKEELAVRGRNGFLIKQKLSFGEFQTTSVKRSWTKGSSWGFGTSLGEDWVDDLSIEFVRRKQTIRFSLVDSEGHESEVTAFTKVRWTDFGVGSVSPGLVNANELSIGFNGQNIFAVRIFTSRSDTPWDMFIDNIAAQQTPKKYSGLLAKSKSEYYTIVPVYKLINKHGKAVALPFGGSFGFEFKGPGNETVAAVSLIDNGIVYFGDLNADERFLLANAAASLLLQQQLSE
jgi:hypothetical protein